MAYRVLISFGHTSVLLQCLCSGLSSLQLDVQHFGIGRRRNEVDSLTLYSYIYDGPVTRLNDTKVFLVSRRPTCTVTWQRMDDSAAAEPPVQNL